MKMPEQIQAFFISNSFICNAKLKVAKNWANPEAKFSLFDDYLHSLYTLSSRNNRRYSKKYAKKQASVYLWDYVINHNEKKDENEK